jgi:hypothetical protein
MDFEDHREHLDHPACLRFAPGGGDVFLLRSTGRNPPKGYDKRSLP